MTEPGDGAGEEHPEHMATSVTRVQEQARHLRARLATLAREVADSEEAIARVYDESAALRPHAADRLTRAAREARVFAAKEREYAASQAEETPPT